jgi:outer membrane protein OmpA-like peptidoglycan-associated protein
MIKNLLPACFLALAQVATAQTNIGYHSSNYAGLNAISINPANIVDSRYKIDINLFAADFRLSNNYLGLSTELFSLRNSPFADTTYNNRFQAFRSDFFRERDYNNMNQARFYQSLNIQGPSVAFNIGKNSFAITTAVREFFFFDNLQPETADFILDELRDQNTWDVSLNNQKFNAVGAVWTEAGLIYGREVLNTGEHYLKAAIHPKLTFAAASAYFYADNLVLNFDNNDTLNVELSDIRFGYSNNLRDSVILEQPYGQSLLNKTSFALDFGFVYEWRPDHAKFRRSDDSSKYDRSKNKYKLKAGLSVTDIGWLKFDRGAFGGNFDGTAAKWNINNIDIQGIESFGQLMADSFNMTTNRDPYRLRLPTSISYQIDYNIWKGFYVNFTGYMAFNQNNAREKTHAINYFALTPRFEHFWGDVSVPMGFDGFGNFEVGTSLRVGPFFIGSTNAWNYLLGSRVRSLNVYSGLRVGIPYSKPKKPKEIKIDPPKVDTPKIDTPKVDTPKVDTPKIDTPKVDTPKVDTPKIDPPKIDTPKVDTPKIDTPKVDTPKIDPPKIDTPKVDTPKIDTPKVDTPKIDTPKIDTPKIDTPKVDTPKVVEPKGNTVFYQGHQFKVKPLEFAFADNAIYFASGSTAITTAERNKLDSLVSILNTMPNTKIVAHGFTDTIGTAKTNAQLAQNRAEAVRKYLASKGIKSERILTNAFGTANPVGDNSNEKGRRLNRRVEIYLLLEEEVKIQTNPDEIKKGK